MLDPLPFDREVRAAIARAIRDGGAIPTIDQVAAMLRTDRDPVDAAFVRMIDGHVFIPQPASHEIYAYNPFCVGPTEFRVRSAGREWWGICGWDALGIPAALGAAGTVETSCADGCGERNVVEVGMGGAARAEGPVVLHIGVEARHFWDDIRFT